MWIVRLALRRPYTFVVAALVLLMMMPYVLLRTPTDIFPNINIPVISVIWQYAGLNAREVEQRIIYTHERSLSATVNDIEHIESNSYNGVGIIKVFLQPGANVDGGVAQITAVAQDSGFADQSHMARHFKRVLGVTPRHFADARGGETV